MPTLFSLAGGVPGGEPQPSSRAPVAVDAPAALSWFLLCHWDVAPSPPSAASCSGTVQRRDKHSWRGSKAGSEWQGWQQEVGSLAACSHLRGISVSHRLSQTWIHQEPPRCCKEKQDPGCIPLLEDIKNEQTGPERGAHDAPHPEQRGAAELLTSGNREGWPRASPVPVRGQLRGRK